MKRTNPFIAVSAGALVLALPLVLTNAGTAAGQLSKSAVDYVTLDDTLLPGACSAGTATERALPDGTKVPFTVPRGKVLVLTDLEGTVSPDYPSVWTASYVGYIATLRLRIETAGEPHRFDARAQVNSNAVSAQIIPVENHLQSGVVAGPGSIVCVQASLSKPNHFLLVRGQARAHGYLMTQ